MPNISSRSIFESRERINYQHTSGALATATNRNIFTTTSQTRFSVLYIMVESNTATIISIKESGGTMIMLFNVLANTPVQINFPMPGLTAQTQSQHLAISHSDAGSINIATTVLAYNQPIS